MANEELTTHLKTIIDSHARTHQDALAEDELIVKHAVAALEIAIRRSNQVFDRLCRRLVISGSDCDRTRVRDPPEFDVNVVLSLPLQIELIPLRRCASENSALVRCRVLCAEEDSIKNELFDRDGFLEQGRLFNWIKDIVTTSATSDLFERPNFVDSIVYTGSPFKYDVMTNMETRIPMNLIPVIEGNNPLPTFIHPPSRYCTLPLNVQKWILFPKFNFNATSENETTHWLIAFPDAEHELIRNHGCVKMLIKLFKLLRDTQRLHHLTSYCIKTLFLLELDVNETFWNEADLGSKFLKMAKKLKNAAEKKKLPYYFQQSYNLLEEMDERTALDIADRMERMLSDVESFPNHVVTYYP